MFVNKQLKISVLLIIIRKIDLFSRNQYLEKLFRNLGYADTFLKVPVN